MSALPYCITCLEGGLGPDECSTSRVGDEVQFNGVSYRCVSIAETSRGLSSTYHRAEDPEDDEDADESEDVLFTEQPY